MIFFGPDGERQPERLIMPCPGVDLAVVQHLERLRLRDQGVTALEHIGSIFRVGNVIEILAGQIVAGAGHHVRAMKPHPEARRIAHRFDQHDIPHQIGDIQGIDIPSGGKRPLAAALVLVATAVAPKPAVKTHPARRDRRRI